jgi:hypothetical protein
VFPLFRTRTALHRIARFCNKNFADRRSDPKKRILGARVRAQRVTACIWRSFVSRITALRVIRPSSSD